MILLKITQNKKVILNDEFKYLLENKWCLSANRYACRREKNSGKIILMHREIMKAKKGEYVDHINGNGLDNRIENLRICTQQENTRNKKKPIHNTSGYKGVCWDKQMKKWRVQIKHKNTNSYIGLFNDLITAAKEYDKKAKEIFGEFAKLNF